MRINESQSKILATMANVTGQHHFASLQHYTKLSDAVLSKELPKLISKGLLSRKGGYYILNETFYENRFSRY